MDDHRPQRNAARPGPVKQAKQAARRKQREADEDLRSVLATVQGQRLVWRLLDRAGVFRTSFTGNSTTFFNEGMRSMGLSLLDDMQRACPEKLGELLLLGRQDQQED